MAYLKVFTAAHFKNVLLCIWLAKLRACLNLQQGSFKTIKKVLG
jgi:hypothetical protein